MDRLTVLKLNLNENYFTPVRAGEGLKRTQCFLILLIKASHSK